MHEKITVETAGKISSISYDKRIMWVKDSLGVTFELKWRAKPEVVDEICQKQKTGYRVRVTTVKDPNEEDAKFWITNCVFDENYKKDKRSYTPSPEEQKLILLQSCFRSGAIVFSAILRNQNIMIPGNNIEKFYEEVMNEIRKQAIADALTLQAEAKKQ